MYKTDSSLLFSSLMCTVSWCSACLTVVAVAGGLPNTTTAVRSEKSFFQHTAVYPIYENPFRTDCSLSQFGGRTTQSLSTKKVCVPKTGLQFSLKGLSGGSYFEHKEGVVVEARGMCRVRPAVFSL